MQDGTNSDSRLNTPRRVLRVTWRMTLYVVFIFICRELAFSLFSTSVAQNEPSIVRVDVPTRPKSTGTLSRKVGKDETAESIFRNSQFGEWNSLNNFAPRLENTVASSRQTTSKPRRPVLTGIRPAFSVMLNDELEDRGILRVSGEEPAEAPQLFNTTRKTHRADSTAGRIVPMPQVTKASGTKKTAGPRRLHLPVAKAGQAQATLKQVGYSQEQAVEGAVTQETITAPEEPVNQETVESGIIENPARPDSQIMQLPLEADDDPGEVQLELEGELLALSFREAPLREVLGVLAESQGLNLICASTVNTKITGNFHSITFDDAMNTVVAVSGLTWTRRNNVIIVTSMTNEQKLAPEAQGRQIRVFTLNYLSAEDVQKAVTGLMSPAGTMVASGADPQDNHKTREQLMVEDLPIYLDRIAEVISQIDVPPQQVLIEAHILEIALKDNQSHGVDFSKLGSIAGTKVLVGTPSFNGTLTDLSTFSSPSYNIGIFNSGSFSGLITALQKTTDAKTLASPQVLALNGQEAHVQIGKRLGYYVTTTTQTSTLQSVNFLDTGVVLTVTPRITEDNQILMSVKPEVSDGAIDALGLPSTTTTEVETEILLPDGKGMIIGGLIKETDVTQQQKVPVLGSLWLIGKLFRRNNVNRERSEIVIALIPRIIGGPHFDTCKEDVGLQKATTPLLHGPLEPFPRPWEAKLPDAIDNPRRFDKSRSSELWKKPSEGAPRDVEYFFPTDGSASGGAMIFESIPVYQTIETHPAQGQPSWAPAEGNYYEESPVEVDATIPPTP